MASMEGIGQLAELKWLSIAKNRLVSLPTCFKNLKKLTYLNASHNQLSTVHELKVTYVVIGNAFNMFIENKGLAAKPVIPVLLYYGECVSIILDLTSSVLFLQHLTNMMEIYLSDNSVTKVRQLFSLKSLISLLVLDLTYNPITTTETYRLFVIFHLHSLKALDGCAVVSFQPSADVTINKRATALQW